MANPQPPARDLRAAAVVVVTVWLALLAASPPVFLRSSDGRAMFATAESLAVRADLAIDDLFLDDAIPVNPSAAPGPDGRAYSKYGIAWPALLAALLSVAAAVGLGPASPAVHTALLTVNPLLSALAAAVTFAMARHLGATRPAATVLGIGGALTTFAWPTGVSDGADPLMSLLVSVSFWGALRYSRTSAPRDALLAGAALGVAVLAKPALVVLAPGVLLAVAMGTGPWSVRLRPVLACGLGIATALAAQLWLNHARWGSPLATGYNDPVLTGDLGVGLWQLTLGINKGLLWHAPLAALGLATTLAAWRRQPAWALATIAGALALIGVTARFYDFGGGWTWGPRYLLPIVPALAAGAALGLGTRAGRALAGTALVAGLAINLPGVVIDGSAARSTFATAWLPEAAGTMTSGITLRPGVLIEQPRPVEDILPEFSGLAVHVWLARVLAEPCACDRSAWWCACADGRDMYWNERFRDPPWRARYPAVEARPPYGQDLLAPALLGAWYRRAVFDVTAAGAPAGGPHGEAPRSGRP